MLQYITFLSLKAIKMSLDFILNYLKKVVGGATTQKYKKSTKTIISSLWMHPTGYQKTRRTKGSITWCVFEPIFSPNWTNFEKPLQNSHFFIDFSNFKTFCQILFNFGWILVQKQKVLLTPLGAHPYIFE